MKTTMTAIIPFDFGNGKHAPDTLAGYLGRRVSSYHRMGTVIKAEPVGFPTRGADGSEMPNARLHIVYPNTDEYGAAVSVTNAAMVAECGKTVLHWSYYEPEEGKADSREIDELKAAAEHDTRNRDFARNLAQEKARAEKAKAEQLWQELPPTWAKAAIVAELDENQSDTMSDYYAHRTTKTVVLAWSKHTRNLFPEMRKAAKQFEETAYLAESSKDAEHRENYSMGGGTYLKDGFRHADGWSIHKVSFKYGRPTFVADFSPVKEA
ncbi:hypothetical protein [Desulfovibrio ferrophilus]|nr:hypothetical protein [Desulfovibrio ferrophilus]